MRQSCSAATSRTHMFTRTSLHSRRRLVSAGRELVSAGRELGSAGRERRGRYSAAAAAPDFEHVIVGAGVVGLAIAARIGNGRTLIIERNRSFGAETSSRNSEIIHAGLHYPEHSLKAQLCIRGNRLLTALCTRAGIPYRITGKWIVAQNDRQYEALQALHDRALRLGVPTRFLSHREYNDAEPDICARAGVLESPQSGIVDSHALMSYLLVQYENNGGSVAYRTTVSAAEKLADRFKISARSDNEQIEITTRVLINAAGLGAVRISNLLLHEKLSAFYAKGNYFAYQASAPKPKRLIYPVPDELSAGLGTHLTLDLSGRMRFGPDVEWVSDPSAVTVNSSRLDSLHKAVKQYLPAVDKTMLVADYAGIRPKLVGPGEPPADFVIRHEEPNLPGFVNLLGIESPGLTSCLAIAEMVENLIR